MARRVKHLMKELCKPQTPTSTNDLVERLRPLH